MPPKLTLEEFLDRIDVNPVTSCWEWQGYRNRAGYGKLGVRYTHRIAYELWVGEIPEGLEIDHLCRNTSCLCPDHLEAVTSAENHRRLRGTHCSEGHLYNREYRGLQHCSLCDSRRGRARQEALGAAGYCPCGNDREDEDRKYCRKCRSR